MSAPAPHESSTRWFHWPIGPVSYAWWEILLMRIGFAGLLWYRLPFVAPAVGQPEPNGIAHWLNLAFLCDSHTFGAIRWVFLAMLLVYIGGRAMFVALPYLLVINVGYMTLGNSQGWIGHTDQIVSLILLVQTIYHLAVTGRRLIGKPWLPSSGRTIGDLEIYFTLQTIAATYLVAALTKLIKTGGSWIAQLPNITVQIAKTNDQFYYDKLVHQNAGLTDWLNQMLVQHPSLAYLIFAPGLLVEASALFLLWGRKQALLIGIILLGMHALIHMVMQITFETNIWLIVFYLLNIPFWLVLGIQKLTNREAQIKVGLPR